MCRLFPSCGVWAFSAPATNGATLYEKLPKEQDRCSASTAITSAAECQQAASALKLNYTQANAQTHYQYGCSVYGSNQVFFNSNTPSNGGSCSGCQHHSICKGPSSSSKAPSTHATAIFARIYPHNIYVINTLLKARRRLPVLWWHATHSNTTARTHDSVARAHVMQCATRVATLRSDACVHNGSRPPTLRALVVCLTCLASHAWQTAKQPTRALPAMCQVRARAHTRAAASACLLRDARETWREFAGTHGA